MRLEEDGRGGRKCTVRQHGSTPDKWAACSDDELAMRAPPTGLLMKFLVFFPYPVIDGVEDLPCVD